MSLKQRAAAVEKAYFRWFDRFISGLNEKEFMAEYLRACVRESGSFTREQVEHDILSTGGDLEEWRPILDEVLATCQVRPGKGQRRWYYVSDGANQHRVREGM